MKEAAMSRYEIGSRIRKSREERGLNQRELGALIGVSSNRVSNWEQGLNRPDADILTALCFALQVSPGELLGVRLSADELSAHERKLIRAYRKKTELRKAVDILLGLDG
jgi:transcriptional regulator with XRE-family HTH domain